MNTDTIKKEALKLSAEFLENEKDYRLGFIESEQPNEKTKDFGEIAIKDTEGGVRCLLSADENLIPLFDKTICSKEFDDFYSDVLQSLKSGGRIILSGCGSSGRLAIRLEGSWRIAVTELCRNGYDADSYRDKVMSLMTGGDYTVIRAVESFEDYTSLGEKQARDLGLCEKDILVGITATAETTSILGTAKQALSDGAKVWMIVCSDPTPSVERLSRAKDVYCHRNCSYIYMKCGGMAITGSTRMQSSTIEQAIIGACLEMCLNCIFENNTTDILIRKELLCEGFAKCIAAVSCKSCVKAIAEQADREAAIYESGGLVTYYADEYLQDVLSDTTERSPTFCVPPFKPKSKSDVLPSWAYVKNPFFDTVSAWTRCFERSPRCIDYPHKVYENIGFKEQDILKIPKIDFNALCEFDIGFERNTEREGKNTLASWIGLEEEIPTRFNLLSDCYENVSVMVLAPGKGSIVETRMKIFEHIAIKLMMNTMSTVTMAKMGRILGNYMVYVNISNKKLVDRATRIISELCDIEYDRANYELYLSKLLMEKNGITNSSVVTETIKRLRLHE